MAYSLKIGVETTLRLDIGMADIVADLGLFAANFTLLTHGILHTYPAGINTVFIRTEIAELAI